ncbi:MAG: dihydrodipicolinate synthase family protein [Rhodospirillales bacterium]|jgi:4-hydroxy-tetrahydrodipicolinate synthase|nr:dihydrodipicolinate synthase family protein [Rhodospirillales bacterium]
MAAKKDPRREIWGYVPAVVSPFNAAGDLMIDRFAEVVRWHLDRGADGICVAGDNGEAWSLDARDRKQLAETAVGVAGRTAHITMGVSATTAGQTIKNAAIAAEAGVDSLMITPQSYVMKASPGEIVGRYRAINKAVGLPILLYNSPRRTGGVNIDIDTLGALCDALPVVGIKESSRDFFHQSHVIRQFARRISVLIGPGHYVFPGLALGAAGFLATGAEFLGDSVGRIRPLAAAKPCAEARDLHHALTTVYQTLMSLGTWPAALKAGLNMIGVPAGVPREPVAPLSPRDSRKLQGVLEGLGLLGGATKRRARR